MKYRILVFALICAAVAVLPTNVLALNSVLSSVFDGSEAKTNPLPGTCSGETRLLGYQDAGVFQVSTSGIYTVVDAYNIVGLDVSALVYQGSFNPNSPQSNLLTPDGIDDSALIQLDTGVNYVLVVQQWCGNPDRAWENHEGAWAVTFSGPGDVTSDKKVSVPAQTQGIFSASDPTVVSDCGSSQYQQVGPVRVSTDGKYYYSDISINYAVDVCLQIYTAPFNPANPIANRIALLDDFDTVKLQAGKDYYFVTQPFTEAANGEFFYIFSPPAPFVITYAISGSWFFPPTTGQGFLIDVFDTANLMFLAWFTYDLERPAAGVTAMIGDPGHRWLTAIGPFQGNTGMLDINWSSGMIFDSESPPVTNAPDGELTVEFFDCFTGQVSYDLGASGRTGTVPIQRIVNDAVPLCETLTQGPAIPGPL